MTEAASAEQSVVDKAVFRCNLSPIMTAITRSGAGGARVQLDISRAWCEAAEPFLDMIGADIAIEAKRIAAPVFGTSGSSSRSRSEAAPQQAEFFCRLAPVSTGVKRSGVGDGVRVQIDISETWYQQAKPMFGWTNECEIEITARRVAATATSDGGTKGSPIISRRSAKRRV